MPGFWSKEKRPPSSPDLYLLDYTIWDEIESKVCATSHPNLKSLEVTYKEAVFKNEIALHQENLLKVKNSPEGNHYCKGGH